ncbi:uncharacterized protein TNCV_1753101 [Trichonephila clavipes]|nr:uncharacterized protein TNCV_1753101 [Trichonephila clavipes]
MEEDIAIVEEKIERIREVTRSLNPRVTVNAIEIISEAYGWTDEVKACKLAAFLGGKATDILQTLPNTEWLTLNTLYNALDLQFSQKYFKDYRRLHMKTRHQKTGESSQEYASEIERLANLAFSDYPANVREMISPQYLKDGLKHAEIQMAFKETSDGKPSCQDIAPFPPTTKRYWDL